MVKLKACNLCLPPEKANASFVNNAFNCLRGRLRSLLPGVEFSRATKQVGTRDLSQSRINTITVERELSCIQGGLREEEKQPAQSPKGCAGLSGGEHRHQLPGLLDQIQQEIPEYGFPGLWSQLHIDKSEPFAARLYAKCSGASVRRLCFPLSQPVIGGEAEFDEARKALYCSFRPWFLI